MLGGYGLIAPGPARRRAREGARRSLEIGPEHPASRVAGGFARFIEYDLTGAESEFLRALEREPGRARAHLWRGLMAAIRTGRWTETARRSAARARRQAPRSPYIQGGVGLINLFAGRPAEGVPRFEDALDLEPEFVLPLYGRALALAAMGRPEEGLPDLEKAASLTNEADFILAFLGATAARAGDRDRAVAVLGRLDRRASERHVDPLHFAFVEAALGRVADAHHHLSEALSLRSPGLTALGRLPLLEPLRDADGTLPPALRQVGLSS